MIKSLNNQIYSENIYKIFPRTASLNAATHNLSSTVENFCGFTLLWIPVLCSLEIFPRNNNNEFLIHFHTKVYCETISSKPEVWLSYHIILYNALPLFKRDVTTRDKQNLSLNWRQTMSGPYMLKALPCNNYYSAQWNNTTESIKKIYK